MTAVKIQQTVVQVLMAQVLHLRVQVLLPLQRISTARKDSQRPKAPRHCRVVLQKASLWRGVKDCARHYELDEYILNVSGATCSIVVLLPGPIVNI